MYASLTSGVDLRVRLPCLKVKVTQSHESDIRLFVTPRTLQSWNSPSQNTGMGSLSLLQGIFPTQGPNPGLRIAGGFFISWATREALPCLAPTMKEGKAWRMIMLNVQIQPDWQPWCGLTGMCTLRWKVIREKSQPSLVT